MEKFNDELLQKDYVWKPITQHKYLTPSPSQHIVSAKGCFLTNAEGTQLLDGTAGLWCVNVGHGRTEIAEIAKTQLETLAYTVPTMTTEPTLRLGAKIVELYNEGEDNRILFSNSGSEANEVAFKIARQYHRQTGNPLKLKIISRYRAYHGSSLATLSATGQAERKRGYGPMAPNFLHISAPYPYRKNPDISDLDYGKECAHFLEDCLLHEGAETVAAFIMEPIISGGGVIVPPDNYLKLVKEICKKYNILLIFDEVVSGFGRTGKMFGHQHWQVKPDIMTLAKGMASGYAPIAATVTSKKIFEAFYGEGTELLHFRHISTYAGNPVSCAISLKNIEIIERESLVEQAEKMGAYLMDRLKETLYSHKYVGDIRGKGLLIGIEFVEDKESKVPLASNKVLNIIKECAAHRILLLRNGNTIPLHDNICTIAPPLVVTEKEADMIVDALFHALQEVS